MRRFALAVSLVLLGVGVLVASLPGRSGHRTASPAPVRFSSFTPHELALGGVELTAAHGAPTAAEGQAAVAAARAEVSLPVIESHFAHCSDTTPRHVRFNEDCWAVSFDTKNFDPVGGTPPGGPPAKPLKYFVVLVEPGTNKILDSQGGRPN